MESKEKKTKYFTSTYGLGPTHAHGK